MSQDQTPRGHSTGFSLMRLEEMQRSGEISGIIHEDDLDFLLWRGTPKDLVMSSATPGYLNFEGLTDKLKITLQSYWWSTSAAGSPIRFEKVIDYDLYTERELCVELTPSILERVGPNGGLVEVGTSVEAALKQSLWSVLGANVYRLSDADFTWLSYMQSTPRDARTMALKAVLMLRQLILMHTSVRYQLKLDAIPITYELSSRSPSYILSKCQSYCVCIDVTRISVLQRRILVRLCSEWPSQRLVKGDNKIDRYCACRLPEESFYLYVSDDCPTSISCDGITLTPDEYWYQVMLLFNELGCLPDLIEVVRDSRGLAPILTLMATMRKKDMCVGMVYPQSRMYHGLTTLDREQIGFLKPSILESSTFTLVIDQLMQTVFLNNCLFMTENLGLGCNEMMRYKDGQSARLTDILMSHGFGLARFDNAANDSLFEWLLPLGNIATIICDVIKMVALNSSAGVGMPLVYVPLHKELNTLWYFSSVSLVKSNFEVTPSEVQGIKSMSCDISTILTIANWSLACSGKLLPRFGASMVGVEITPELIEMLDDLWQYTATYKHHRLAIKRDYTSRRELSGTMSKTFFFNKKYMRSTENADTQTQTNPIQ